MAEQRSALIFAGGRATRLGGLNKALLDVGGRPIVRRILDALEPLVDERVILTNDEALLAQPKTRLVFDPTPFAGVLTALASGLETARGDLCLAVACDMPFVSRLLFERLLQTQRERDADVVIPRTAGFLEPMHAVYRRERVLAAIRAALGRGEQRMVSYFGAVHVEELGEGAWQAIDPAGRAFFNVNTPDDLAEARRLAREQEQPE
ncbi:MAG TPA: molybdenum cofactor guanylyltransferase [Chloroflexota bacterium]|nr:molybdenum cofactor guanylyltransferase [Chloroflexota bacterium]